MKTQAKILLLKPSLLAKTNGGERSIIEYLQFLKSIDLDVSAQIALPCQSRKVSSSFLKRMGTPLSGAEYSIGNLSVKLSFDHFLDANDYDEQDAVEKVFFGVIEKEQPDFVLAHYTDFFAVTAALKWNPERTFVFITDNEYPRQIALNQFPKIAESFFELKHLIVPSPFLKRSVKTSIPWAKSIYIPNILETLELGKIPRRVPLYWLFVNPIPQKGIDFVLDLARQLPTERFIFVNFWGNISPDALPRNVSLVPVQENLWKLFSRTKGLLVPSTWQEGFGRIPIEAMCAGVPVITSNRGNLPHTVGDGGYCLPLHQQSWIDAMKEVETNSHEIVSRGLQRVEEYRSELNLRLSALQRLFGWRAPRAMAAPRLSSIS